ncbi:MAG TPA: zf-HC2 domain-containing protein, partial [Candidatus Binataceae bacterium]
MNSIQKNSDALDRVLQHAMSAETVEATPLCPGAGVIAAYFDRSLNSAERIDFERHLAGCAHCQAMLAALVRTDTSVAEPKYGVARLGGWRVAAPALAAVLATIFVIGVFRHNARESEQLAALSKSQRPAARNEFAKESPIREQSPPAVGELAQNETPPAAKQEQAQRASQIGAKPKAEERRPESPQMYRMQQPLPVRPGPGVPAPASVAAGASALAGAPAPTIRDQIAARQMAGMARTESAIAPSAGKVSSLVTIAAPDGSEFWIVGRNGTVYRRDARGMTRVSSGVATDLVSGTSPAPQVCWIVGRAGTILRTTDGSHFDKIQSPTPTDLISIAATNADSAT